MSLLMRSLARQASVVRTGTVMARIVSPSVSQVRLFTKKTDDPESLIPDEFFDEKTERGEIVHDYSRAVNRESLESLVYSRGASESRSRDAHLPKGQALDLTEVEPSDKVPARKPRPPTAPTAALKNFINPDIVSHMSEFSGRTFYRPEEMDYNVNWRTHKTHPDPILEKFMANTNPDKFAPDNQGLRACEGKKQRSGPQGVLRCHLIDLHRLTHLDVTEMSRFLSEDSEILGRKDTGLCAKCQRQVAKTIKRARAYGLLSHIGEYTIEDAKPKALGTNGVKLYHSSDASPLTESRNIL